MSSIPLISHHLFVAAVNDQIYVHGVQELAQVAVPKAPAPKCGASPDAIGFEPCSPTAGATCFELLPRIVSS